MAAVIGHGPVFQKKERTPVKGWGIMLLILGIGSLILPHFGIQFRLLTLVEEAQPMAGIVVAGVGGLVFFLGLKADK